MDHLGTPKPFYEFSTVYPETNGCVINSRLCLWPSEYLPLWRAESVTSAMLERQMDTVFG